MAVRVPGALKVVPNPLLGYAGGWGCAGGMGGGVEQSCRACPGHPALADAALPAAFAGSAHPTVPTPPSAASLPAGSLLLRAILSASLPNFLELLGSDYRQWAGLDAGAAGRQLDAPVGDLFSDAAAAVREGRERRQQQQEHAGEAPRAGEQQRAEQERERVP